MRNEEAMRGGQHTRADEGIGYMATGGFIVVTLLGLAIVRLITG